ncbi:hypothetical protein [Lacticaseibacillus kribbianus]|uniref:hypothetical protein n=1 Tax=Lacticaseibacillus kribbianus TaxID=2926292 RepID=UPI001CD52C71|nr:hypothetical protein [Lacticaseibacillus kribbianus]
MSNRVAAATQRVAALIAWVSQLKKNTMFTAAAIITSLQVSFLQILITVVYSTIGITLFRPGITAPLTLSAWCSVPDGRASCPVLPVKAWCDLNEAPAARFPLTRRPEHAILNDGAKPRSGYGIGASAF